MFSKYFLFIFLKSFSDILLVTSQSETDYACLRKYKNKLCSDYLLGDWYPQYKFNDDGLIPTTECAMVSFTRPTAKEIQDYKAYYSNISRPFSFDEQPLRCVKDGHLSMIDGMVLGSTEVKFYVHDPKSVLGGKDRYHARAIRRINDNYHLFLECDRRGHVLWLYSRNRNNSEQELQEVIKTVPEFKRKQVQKFCAIEKEYKTC